MNIFKFNIFFSYFEYGINIFEIFSLSYRKLNLGYIEVNVSFLLIFFKLYSDLLLIKIF
jgi:hypothetical protein